MNKLKNKIGGIIIKIRGKQKFITNLPDNTIVQLNRCDLCHNFTENSINEVMIMMKTYDVCDHCFNRIQKFIED